MMHEAGMASHKDQHPFAAELTLTRNSQLQYGSKLLVHLLWEMDAQLAAACDVAAAEEAAAAAAPI